MGQARLDCPYCVRQGGVHRDPCPRSRASRRRLDHSLATLALLRNRQRDLERSAGAARDRTAAAPRAAGLKLADGTFADNKHRLKILFGISMLILFSGYSPGDTGQPVVPQHVIAEVNERCESNARFLEYQAEREATLWAMLVDAIAKETRITDRELAETVTQAIEDASAEFDMDPWLVASLIRVESAGDPTAVSHVGAIGLTQIMPRTGKEIAFHLGIENYSTELLYDPAINVRMGTFYLRRLLDRFDDDLYVALAAYNWGPTHIAKRISKREAIPVQYPAKILRRIPEQPAWVEKETARS